MLIYYFILGYVAENTSFYASLRAGFTLQEQDFKLSELSDSFHTNNDTEWRFVYIHFFSLKKNIYLANLKNFDFITKCMYAFFLREPNEKNEEIEIDNSVFDTILEEIKVDYQNGGPQIRIALDKFVERYAAAKSKSIPRLCSFLYNPNHENHELDPKSRVKSGSKIHVQVESIKRRKTEVSGSGRRKLPTARKDKENLDPQVIPTRKKKKASKKVHNLNKNILANQPN
jgi:hypothetical protein